MISKEEIKEQTREVGKQIAKDYKDKDLVLVGVLKGSFIFLADLTRQIAIDHEIDLVGASSYEGTSSTGQIVFTKQPDLELEGRDVLLVEDIVDTGQTLSKIIEFVQLLNPRSVKICTLKFGMRRCTRIGFHLKGVNNISVYVLYLDNSRRIATKIDIYIHMITFDRRVG